MGLPWIIADLPVGAFEASQAANPGRLRLTGTYNLRTEQYDARADVTQWTLSPTADQPLAATVDAMFTGAGSLDQPHGMGTLRATGVTVNGTTPGDLVAEVQLDGQAANISALKSLPSVWKVLNGNVYCVHSLPATNCVMAGMPFCPERLAVRTTST